VLAFLLRFVSNANPMHPKIALTILFFALAGSLSAQNRVSEIQLSKISRDLITAPNYSYSGAEQLRESHDRWLKIEVQFSALPEFTDEVTFLVIFVTARLVNPAGQPINSQEEEEETETVSQLEPPVLPKVPYYKK